MNPLEHCLAPDWPAPPQVRAFQTTRRGGMSATPYASFNLGDHVGDDPMMVMRNRMLLSPYVPSEPVWLKQVHGMAVVDAAAAGCLPVADASIARQRHAVCVVMTADCLPVLLCNESGSVVGAVHAGWRGLRDGVIEATVAALAVPPHTVMAWLGSAISQRAFEVGGEVREEFMKHAPAASRAFIAKDGGKWMADIYLLARQRLQELGVSRIYGGGLCTYGDAEKFYSYRRDGVTGRMGSFIWLE